MAVRSSRTRTWSSAATREQSVSLYSLHLSLLTSILEVFATEILVPLSRFKLLDSFFRPLLPSKSLSVPIAYLERRVLNERHDGALLLVRIRDVAIQLPRGSSDAQSEHDYIRQLCPLVVDQLKERMNKIWATERALFQTNEFFYGSQLDSDVYVAAIYTQTFLVVAKWIMRGEKNGSSQSALW
jgi:hypothetical protein